MNNTAVQPQSPRVPQTLRQQLAGDYFKQQVALALPKHMTADRFVRVGLTALLKTPKLADCTPESVIQCMLACSSLGLEPDGRRAHLIPYGNVCTLIVDYKGIVELAKRSGDVSGVFAQVVCENDSFEWENGEVKHQIDWKRDRGAMYAAYATITFRDGSKQTDVMTKAEIDAIRRRSKAGNSGPWVTDYNEMAKKTVFRRASKWITLSPEVADALEKEDAPFSSSSMVTDISAPPVAPEPVSVLPDPVDDVPMGNPAQAAPEPLQANQPIGETLQDKLAKVCKDAGFDYDDFGRWAIESGNVPDADTKDGFGEIHDAICKRLLRSQAGMLKGIATVKGLQS
jgi:recombination protein RecT